MSDTISRNREWYRSEYNPFSENYSTERKQSEAPSSQPAPIQGRLFDPDKYSVTYTEEPSSQKTLMQVKEIRSEVAEIRKMLEDLREALDSQAEALREVVDILIDNE
jgi:hypothetical protein